MRPIICLSLLLVLQVQANWPQFRGPQASGLDKSAVLPIEWDLDSERNVLWKTPLSGLAHSCPVVWEDHVYVTTAISPGVADLKVGLYGNIDSVTESDSIEWRLLCLDRMSGDILWNTVAHAGVPRVKRHTKATHCNSTPATDGERIVALFGSEGLFCFDMQGTQIWKKDLGPMDSGYYRAPSAQWGFGSSPIIFQDTVIVQCDLQTNSFLMALRLEDGQTVWKQPRQDVPTWSTPTVLVGKDQTQVIVNGWRHTGGYDFQTGQVLWKLRGGGDIPVPTPIFSTNHELIYLTSAHGRFRPMRAVRTDARGDITPENPGATNQSIVWAHPRKGNYMQTPILLDDLLWACADNGILTCFDARTGAIHYEERLSAGQGFTASPVTDGRHLYFTSELGEVFLVPATSEFSINATNQLHETVLATPAIADGTLFFRTRAHLIAIGKGN